MKKTIPIIKRSSAIEEAIKQLQESYGSGVILREDDIPENVKTYPTGSFSLDYILGAGGLPEGRIIEISGEPSCGKSTISLFLVSQLQKQGVLCSYLDAENSFDRIYAEKLGVDVGKLLVSQPQSLEEAFDIVKILAKTNEVGLIVVDSVASLTPKSELEAMEGDNMLKDSVAVQARLLSKALRIITGPLARSKTTVIFINQTRSNIGQTWGDKEVSVGGKALKFYSSIRLKVQKGDKIKEKDEVVGHELKITAIKNKVAAPWRTGSVKLYFGDGVDLSDDLLVEAVKQDVVKKEGNTYKFGEVKLGTGFDSSVVTLDKDKLIYDEIRAQIIKKITEEKDETKQS